MKTNLHLRRERCPPPCLFPDPGHAQGSDGGWRAGELNPLAREICLPANSDQTIEVSEHTAR
jgi:hypothetical protein